MSTPPLPTVRGLHQLAVARANEYAAEHPVFAFGEVPPDESSRGVAYWIIDPDPGFDQIARADGKVSSRRGRFFVRCCGSSLGQASFSLDHARAAFLNWWPYEDPRFGMARETESDPLTIDRTVPTDPRYVFGLTYEVDD